MGERNDPLLLPGLLSKEDKRTSFSYLLKTNEDKANLGIRLNDIFLMYGSFFEDVFLICTAERGNPSLATRLFDLESFYIKQSKSFKILNEYEKAKRPLEDLGVQNSLKVINDFLDVYRRKVFVKKI